MTYTPSDGVSLAELIRQIRLRTGDFPQRRVQSETGDGTTTIFPLSGQPHEDSGMLVTVDGSGTTAFTTDYDYRRVTMDSAPTAGQVIVLRYDSVTWIDERIQFAINSAIDQLFGEFYVEGTNSALTTDSSGQLLVETAAGYDLGAEDRVKRVRWWNGIRFVRWDSWKVSHQSGKTYVIFERDPGAGQTIEVTYQVRPGPLDTASATLEGTSGMLDRAAEPIILFAIASLQGDRHTLRVRDDRAHTQQDEGAVKPYDILNNAQYLRAEAQRLAKKLAMEPQFSRVAY